MAIYDHKIAIFVLGFIYMSVYDSVNFLKSAFRRYIIIYMNFEIGREKLLPSLYFVKTLFKNFLSIAYSNETTPIRGANREWQ